MRRLETRAAELSAQVDEALRSAGGGGSTAGGADVVGGGLADRVASLEAELAAKHSHATDLSVCLHLMPHQTRPPTTTCVWSGAQSGV